MTMVEERIQKVWSIQKERWESEGFVHAGHITGERVDELIEISSSVRKLLDDSVEKAGLSRRERHKILRLSRTIADLQGIVT